MELDCLERIWFRYEDVGQEDFFLKIMKQFNFSQTVIIYDNGWRLETAILDTPVLELDDSFSNIGPSFRRLFPRVQHLKTEIGVSVTIGYPFCLNSLVDVMCGGTFSIEICPAMSVKELFPLLRIVKANELWFVLVFLLSWFLLMRKTLDTQDIRKHM